MLVEKDGTPKALRSLIGGRLLTVIQKASAAQFHLAVEHGDRSLDHGLLAAHRHFYLEICFCLAGRAQVWTGPTIQDLSEGDVLVIAPGVRHCAASLHAITISPETAYSRLLWLATFPYGCVFNLCETSRGSHQSTPRQLVIENHVNNSIQEMFLELRADRPCSRLMAKWKLLEALTSLYRVEDIQWADKDTPPTVLGTPAATSDTPGSARETHVSHLARKFIDEHFDSNLDLNTIANAISTSKSHLCRAFKRDNHQTVIEYLTRVRIDASRKLLLTTLPVSSVSRLVGFEDPLYFSRVFHRIAGISPTDYRLSQLGEWSSSSTVRLHPHRSVRAAFSHIALSEGDPKTHVTSRRDE